MQSFKSRIIKAFSLLACISIVAQSLIYYGTLLVVEDAVSERRVKYFKEIAIQYFESERVPVKNTLRIDEFTMAYRDFNDLPDIIQESIAKSWVGLSEIETRDRTDDRKAFMVLAAPSKAAGENGLIYVVEDMTIIESPISQRFTWLLGYIGIIMVLLAVACLGIVFIARRLTAPLRQLEILLQNASPSDLSPLVIPKNSSLEIHQLTNSLNNYRDRIRSLIQRERSFTSYASHELRTPLTIVRGVASLLDVSSEAEFLQRQKQRLLTATGNMNDVIETLLNLARESGDEELLPLAIEQLLVEQVVEDHTRLLRGNPVETEVVCNDNPVVYAPETMVRILLANLVRNAMAHTEQGKVAVKIDKECLSVIDTGSGLADSTTGSQGFGQGLLIVNDICRKYGWQFSLENNEHSTGCTAKVIFSKS